MRYSSQQYAEALYRALEHKNSSSEVDKVVSNFVKKLKEDGVLYKFNSILKAYKTILTKNNQLPEVIITSASELSEQVKRSILHALKIDEKVNLRLRIDKKIIGGVFVKYNDRLFDLSIARRLARLSRRLLLDNKIK